MYIKYVTTVIDLLEKISNGQKKFVPNEVIPQLDMLISSGICIKMSKGVNPDLLDRSSYSIFTKVAQGSLQMSDEQLDSLNINLKPCLKLFQLLISFDEIAETNYALAFSYVLVPKELIINAIKQSATKKKSETTEEKESNLNKDAKDTTAQQGKKKMVKKKGFGK